MNIPNVKHHRALPTPCRTTLAAALSQALLWLASPSAQALVAVSGPYFSYPAIETSGLNVEHLLRPDVTLWIGDGAPGSFLASAGSQVRLSTMVVGPNVGSSAASVTGIGTRLELVGSSNIGRLTVGNVQSTGTFRVSHSAVLDATGNPSQCRTQSFQCQVVVGGTTRATGTLIVETNARASFIGQFAVGGPWAMSYPGGAGGTSKGTVQVLTGGLLETEGGLIGSSFTGSAGNGTERSVADVLVQGAGSTWAVKGYSIGNEDTVLDLASGPLARATLNVLDGATVTVVAGGQQTAQLNVARGGTATMVLAGAGLDNVPARLEVIGRSASINVGEGGGTGRLEIRRGSHAFVDGLVDSSINIGMSGSTGELIVAGGTLAGARRLHVGADGRGSIAITEDGQVQSGWAFVGGTGPEQGPAVRISGTGSQWVVDGAGTASFALVASSSRPGHQTVWEIDDGGALRIEAAPGQDAHLRLAQGGGTSVMQLQGSDANGSASTLALNGRFASIYVGESGGTGQLEIRQGARTLVNGSHDSLVAIGLPGSAGEVIVTGGGTLSGARNLSVGAGGRGILTVSAGGHVQSETAFVDGLPGESTPVVRLTGAQTTWAVTGNDGIGLDALVSSGRSTASRTAWEIDNGAALRIVAQGGREAHLRLAHGPGTSAMRLQGTDAGGHASALDVVGSVASINVGEAGGRGLLEIRQGARTFIQGALDSAVQIGLPGSTGEVIVAGGELTGPERIVVGAGGSGRIAITDGGRVRSQSAIVDGWAPLSTPLVTISGAGSRWLVTGSAAHGTDAMVRSGTSSLSETRWTIDAGGLLDIHALEGRDAHLRLAHGGGTTTLLVTGTDASGVASRLNVIGRVASINVGESGGTARLAISQGAQTFIGGTHDSYMNIGMPGSTGDVLVTRGVLAGAARINVGNGGNGSLSLDDGALLTQTSRLSVGSDGGTGWLDIRGPMTEAVLSGTVASLRVGSAASIGQAVIDAGASVTLNGTADTELVISESQGQPAPGVQPGRGSLRIAGGSQLVLQGGPEGDVVAVVGKGQAGVMELDGASRMVLTRGPQGSAQLVIGQGGTGIVTLAGGSRVDVPGGAVRIANAPDTRGELVLREGSRLEASYVGVGAGFVLAGACGFVHVLDTSVLKAATLEAGSCAHINGSGTIEANVDLSGTLSPGNSPGSLKIVGNLTARPGATIELEIESNGAGGFNTDEIVFADGALVRLAGAEISFRFLGATDPNAFRAQGAFLIDRFFAKGAGGELEHGLFAGVTFTASADSYVFESFSFTADGGAVFSAVAVPEPAAWVLALAGLAVLTHRARRPSRH